ncbi:MAG TPA: amino acid adenylation domain-containing protein, partial [Pyrinomonadaceae bacterium]|nr:amino acid adenylation domain-containing protein [Pyrinomonadaceae bacterium]
MQEIAITGCRLSPQQKRLWLLQQVGQQPYHAQCVVLLKGRLDTQVLKTALAEVTERNEILRTNFPSLPGMSLPLQVIAEDGLLSIDEYSPEESNIDELLQQARRDTSDTQLRVSLIKLSIDEHALVLSLPAMYSDATGLRNLVEKISSYYESILVGEPPADEPVQYADLSEWQTELLEAENAEAGKKYWRKQNPAGRQAVKLPFEREAKEPDFMPQFASVTIDAAATKQIEAIAKKHETTISVFLLSCWQVLLRRLTEQSQVTVGAYFDGRNYQGLESALGLFSRHLPISLLLEEDVSFSQLLTLTTEIVDESGEYQEYFTWEEEGRFPFCYEYVEEAEGYEAGGVNFSIVNEYACTERFEVKLSCRRSAGGMKLEFHYDASCYHDADMQRLGAQYQRLLQSVVSTEHALISELEVVSEPEREQQLVTWNETGVVYESAANIVELFERQAAARPEAIAVVCGKEALSYAELNERANQLGHYLRRVGAGPEVLVGLCVERSLAMVVGVLGILKAGGAYVPLDASYPASRLELTLRDCGAAVVLTQAHLLERLGEQLKATGAQLLCLDRQWAEIARESVANVKAAVAGENLAYVIYTSGSTGRPKGVGVTQQNLLHTTRAREVYYRTTPRSFLLLSSIAFDSSVAGLFWTLSGGGQLVVPEEGMQREARSLVELVQEKEVTHLLSLPSLYALLLEEGNGSELASLEGVIVAGEVCGPALVQRHVEVASQTALYNEYGPTEGSVWSTVQQCVVESVVPIGRPIANVRMYVLEPGMRIAPLGLSGELYVGGAGVTRGYLNDATQTAQKFVPDPFSGESGGRLYRTGDRARYRTNGEIEFLGRVDNQVKIRGYRIELGEIETVLREHPAVREGVTVAIDDRLGGQRLVSYLVLEERHAFTASQLLRYKREGLLARLKTCELPNGMTIVHHNKNEANYLYHEIFEEQAYFDHGIQLTPGACVFDVGANIGLFSLFVAHMCEGARIYAFEPIPQIFKVLRANSELYGLNIRLFECGLCNEEQCAVFTYYPHLSLMSGLFADAGEAQSVVKSFEVNKHGGMPLPSDAAFEELLNERLETEQVECQLRTISDVIAEEAVEQIDLLKVDAEKSELNVLLGIKHADWAKIKQVVVELEDREQRLEQITGLLRSKGFELAVEQDLALANTRLYKVYAIRPAQNHDATRKLNKKVSPIPKTAWSSPAVVSREVRELLKAKLPEHMIPGALVLLEELPLMPNGKIDRLALPAPEQVVSEEEISLPRTPVEETLAGIWSEVLGVRELSVTANFFELGGHSLLATQVMSRVRAAFQVELPVRSLFAQPTVRGLAAEIEAQMQA